MVMKRNLVIIYIICTCFLVQSKAQSVNDNCKYNVDGGEYKLLWKSRTIRGENRLLLHILVKPKNVKRDYLIQLTKRVKSEYCNERKILVVIFDDRKMAEKFHRTDYFLSKNKIIERGYYQIDKEKGEELLEFSTKRGNPTTDVKIDLSEISDKSSDTIDDNQN